MRIGIDCRIFGTGFTGIGRYTYELAKHFIDINEKLECPHELVFFLNQKEYKEFETGEHSKKVLVKAKHYSLAEQFKLPGQLRKEKCDVIHFPHFNVPLFYRKPFTVTIHDLTLSLFAGRKMRRWHHKLAYNLTIKSATRRAKKIIAVSRHTKKDIVKHLYIPDEKIQVVYNGVDPKFKLMRDLDKLTPTLKKYKIEKPFLLYTGVWRSHKNLPRLIEAFGILKREKRLDLQLVITGNPDPLHPEVKETVKNLRLKEDVIFPGAVSEEELIYLYNAASIFVFPSLYEGFGLPVLEAMSCGTPVAASDTSSIPEVCGKDNAVFFNPKNTQEIAESITMLYKNVDLQVRLIERGLRRASEFSWRKAAEESFKIITHV